MLWCDSVSIYIFACWAHRGADFWDKPEQLLSQQWWDWNRVVSESLWLMASVSSNCHREDILCWRQGKNEAFGTMLGTKNILIRQGRQGQCFHSQSLPPFDIFLAFTSHFLWSPFTFLLSHFFLFFSPPQHAVSLMVLLLFTSMELNPQSRPAYIFVFFRGKVYINFLTSR